MTKNLFDGFLPKAIIFSLCLHTLFMGGAAVSHLPHLRAKKENRIEIAYRPQAKKDVDLKQRPIRPSQKFDLKSNLELSSEGVIPLKMERDHGMGNMMIEHKPQAMRASRLERKINIVPIKSAKINNPAYTAYQQTVRNRIEQKVYEIYEPIGEGRVYVTFIIAANGALKAVQILESRTQATQTHKDISLRSVRESQFPPFLEGMTLPEYTFNIEIQYQIKEQ